MSHTETILGFDTLEEPPGLEIIDRLEQLRYQLRTPEPVRPTPISPAEFLFPAGKGVRVTTESLVLPDGVSIFVRDGDGDMVTEVQHLDSVRLEDGSYILDLSSQVKTYIEMEGPVEITVDLFDISVEFDSPTQIDIGFRSRHTRPAATVTTTTDPVDMMTAIATFGSALKSTSPERSFPTLRGHPPTIELGSSLSIPEQLEPPDTGVTIAVPPRYDRIFPVAPLAYYLGADVVSGPQAQVRTDRGFTHSLDCTAGFEQAVERTLKQVFFLDCVTRTEGFYAVTLSERRELEREVDLDWGTLYELPVADRIERYLSVPYDLLEDQIPQWRLTANVEPVAETVEQLPFVVDDLAVVRTKETPQPASTPSDATISSDFSDEVLTRSTSSPSPQTRSSTAQSDDEATYVEFEPADSLEQAWIGSGIPIGASKLIPAAFHNRLDRDVTAGDIAISVVLNDARMDAERDVVADVYGNRENLPFDVTISRNLTVGELEDRLRKDCDFLHYIGHTDRDGFECADGKLDVHTLDDVNVDSFLLNACSSYHQGLGLIEAGSIGGIVTLTDIINDDAVAIGETIARLLNSGFPLRAALSIAREESVLGGQYIVVGDGGMTVTQSPSRTPNLVEIKSTNRNYEVTIHTFATDTAGLGTMYVPNIGENTDYILASNDRTYSVPKTELQNFLDLQNVPVRSDTGLSWSNVLSIE